MKLVLLCIGKLRNAEVRALCGEYARRLKRYGPFDIRECKAAGNADPKRGAEEESRRLCAACKKPVNVEEQALIDAGVPAERIGTFQVFEPNGCAECNDRGYRGRVAVYEVMPFWDGLKELVINGAAAAEIKQEAIRLGMQTLRMAALEKMMGGMTSLAEVVGNTAPDRF